MCGGTGAYLPGAHVEDGLSPRVRGNHGLPVLDIDESGSIPACAGEPAVDLGLLRGAEVYPRVCGGTVARCGRESRQCGLSPRVRGNRVVLRLLARP